MSDAHAGERPRLSVVFPTMNRVDYLKSSIASLRRELDGRHTYEIVVVVGGSDAASLEFLKTQETVRIVDEGAPRGCCYAFDLGLRAARGEWVCWLNDDIEVTPGAFDTMLAFMSDPANTGVGLGAFPNSRSRGEPRNFVIRGVWDQPAIYADFGCMRQELLETLGYLDLGFRKYGWDPDLSLRVWERGLRVAPCEGANIVHFFAEDALRAGGDAHLEADTDYLNMKWDGKRREGRFSRVFADQAYLTQVMRLLAGWPRLNLRLHCEDLDGLWDEAATLYAKAPRVAAPRYYAFGLELMKRRRFAEAQRVFRELAADAASGDPMLAWYQYKCGESLKDLGQAAQAGEWFQLAAASGHVMSRLALLETAAPLRVALGPMSTDGGQDRIYVPLNLQDPAEWDYYFSARPMDDALLTLAGNELGTDWRVLARMLALYLAGQGRLRIAAHRGAPAARAQALLLAEELRAQGFQVTPGREGVLTATRGQAAAQAV